MLATLVQSHARRMPQQVAWIEASGRRLGWSNVANDVTQLRDKLSSLGLQSGDIAVTQLPNGLDPVLYSIALNSLGVTESPIDLRLGSDFVDRAIGTLGAKWLINEEGCRPTSAIQGTKQAWPELRRPALILWTSGTTEHPKAVVQSWARIIGNARGKLLAVPQSICDVRLTLLPLSHAYARTCDFGTWLLSGCAMAAGDGWSGLERLGALVEPTVINAVPYLIDKLLGLDQSSEHIAGSYLRTLGLRRLRLLGCGGAALSEQRFNQIKELGMTPIQGYGLTETSPVICSSSPWDTRPGVVGRPVRFTQVRISGDGEIQVRGPGIMQGYWQDPTATRNRFTEDNWFRTGDLGSIEEDGMLCVQGRIDDVIVLSNGRKFWPTELERRLATLTGAKYVVLAAAGANLEAIVDLAEPTDSALLLSRIQQAQRTNEPRVVKVRIVEGAFGIATGELTVKSTIRRRAIYQRFMSES